MSITPKMISCITREFHNTTFPNNDDLDAWNRAIGDASDEAVMAAVESLGEDLMVATLAPSKLRAKLRRAVTTQQDAPEPVFSHEDELRKIMVAVGIRGADIMPYDELCKAEKWHDYQHSLKFYGKNCVSTYSKWVRWQVSLGQDSFFPELAVQYMVEITAMWTNSGKKTGDVFHDPFGQINSMAVAGTKKVAFQHAMVDRGPAPRNPRDVQAVKDIYIEKHSEGGRL